MARNVRYFRWRHIVSRLVSKWPQWVKESFGVVETRILIESIILHQVNTPNLSNSPRHQSNIDGECCTLSPSSPDIPVAWINSRRLCDRLVYTLPIGRPVFETQTPRYDDLACLGSFLSWNGQNCETEQWQKHSRAEFDMFGLKFELLCLRNNLFSYSWCCTAELHWYLW